MQVHQDCESKQDEKKRKSEPVCRCMSILNDDTAGSYCPAHGYQR